MFVGLRGKESENNPERFVTFVLWSDAKSGGSISVKKLINILLVNDEKKNRHRTEHLGRIRTGGEILEFIEPSTWTLTGCVPYEVKQVVCVAILQRIKASLGSVLLVNIKSGILQAELHSGAVDPSPGLDHLLIYVSTEIIPNYQFNRVIITS